MNFSMSWQMQQTYLPNHGYKPLNHPPLFLPLCVFNSVTLISGAEDLRGVKIFNENNEALQLEREVVWELFMHRIYPNRLGLGRRSTLGRASVLYPKWLLAYCT